LATPGKQISTPNSEGGEYLEPYAAVKDSQDRWNNERAEADHKAEAEEKEEEGGKKKKKEPQKHLMTIKMFRKEPLRMKRTSPTEKF